MKDKPPSSRVPESKIREITEAVERGQQGILLKFLKSLPSAADRVEAQDDRKDQQRKPL